MRDVHALRTSDGRLPAPAAEKLSRMSQPSAHSLHTHPPGASTNGSVASFARGSMDHLQQQQQQQRGPSGGQVHFQQLPQEVPQLQLPSFPHQPDGDLRSHPSALSNLMEQLEQLPNALPPQPKQTSSSQLSLASEHGRAKVQWPNGGDSVSASPAKRLTNNAACCCRRGP